MKAKKKTVKHSAKVSSSKTNSINHVSHEHHKNARAVLALLVLLLAFCVLIIFAIYQNNILQNGMFKPFMALAVVFMGFLASLLFLAGKPSK